MKFYLLNHNSEGLSILFFHIMILFFLQLIVTGITNAGQNIFQGKTDIGKIKLQGSVHYDESKNIYRIT